MGRYRGAIIGALGLAVAGMALERRSSLPAAALVPVFVAGGVIAIVGLALIGYDYSRRSGADLLERGIWQAALPEGAVSTTAPLLRDALPEFAEELRALLLAERRADLAGQLDDLRLVDRCRCGDDFCATLYTRRRPEGAWGPGHRTIELAPRQGTVNVDLVMESIVSVEVLYRDDVKARLASVCP